jgi:hypothetical protein
MTRSSRGFCLCRPSLSSYEPLTPSNHLTTRPPTPSSSDAESMSYYALPRACRTRGRNGSRPFRAPWMTGWSASRPTPSLIISSCESRNETRPTAGASRRACVSWGGVQHGGGRSRGPFRRRGALCGSALLCAPVLKRSSQLAPARLDQQILHMQSRTAAFPVGSAVRPSRPFSAFETTPGKQPFRAHNRRQKLYAARALRLQEQLATFTMRWPPGFLFPSTEA